MKRPLAVIGLTYLATSAAAVCFFPEVNIIFGITAAVTAIAAGFAFCEKVRDILTVSLPICLAFLVIGCCQFSANSLTDKLSGCSCLISGEICEIPQRKSGKWRYIIKTDKIDIPDVKQNIRILVTSGSSIDEAMEGDRLICEVTFTREEKLTGYSSVTSLRADGITAKAWCVPGSKQSMERGIFRLRYVPLKIKRSIISAIRRALPDNASAMLCGMLLGDTDYMDSRITDNFRASGISHLLAVSGLHLTLLTMALRELLRKLRQTRKTSSIIAVGFIILFMAVTGFSPSVVRAGVMNILIQIAGIIHRTPDTLTSVSIASILMCVFNPWAAADIGLQLSVCSTLGLLLMQARFYDALLIGTKKALAIIGKRTASPLEKRAGKSVLHSLAVSFAAMISVLPITVVHFGSVSLISPLTNLVCIFPAELFIIAGILSSMIYCIPLAGWLVSLPFRLAASAVCVYLEAVTGALAGLPVSTLNTELNSAPFLIFFILAIILFSFIFMRKINDPAFSRRLRKFVLCEAAVLVLAASLSNELFCRGPEITVFNASSGGVCVCAKNRTHAVFAEAGGNSYDMSVIRRTLRKNGISRIDAIAISDDSSSRSGNADAILMQYSPDCLITDVDIFADTGAKKLPFDSSVNVDSHGLRIDTFTDSDGKNWQRLCCKKVTAVVCPEKGNCMLLPDEWKSTDVIVAGKEIYGISMIQTGVIIITAKESSAGKTRQRLQNLGYRHVYSTASDGAVTVSSANGKLRVKTGN